LKPRMAAVRTLYIATAIGNNRSIDLVFSVAVWAYKTHVLSVRIIFWFSLPTCSNEANILEAFLANTLTND